MADKQSDADAQAQNIELRVALNDAYAAVEGAKAVQTFSALTFEECLDQQIQRIEGTRDDGRPNELERVQKTLANLQQAVSKIKSLPPEAFAKPDPEKDVNTT